MVITGGKAKTILLQVPNQFLADDLETRKPALQKRLQRYFPKEEFVTVVEVNVGARPQNMVPYSDKDKMADLLQKYPTLQSWVDNLGLVVE